MDLHMFIVELLKFVQRMLLCLLFFLRTLQLNALAVPLDCVRVSLLGDVGGIFVKSVDDIPVYSFKVRLDAAELVGELIKYVGSSKFFLW